MKNCHECDSEVSGQEPYCPFCGILLEPIAPVAAEDDDSLESTIMMPPDEIARLAAEAKENVKPPVEEPANVVPAESAVVAGSDDEPDHEIKEDGISAQETIAEDKRTQEELPDVPPPAILSEPSDTSDNINVRLTSEHTKDELLEQPQSATITEPDIVDIELAEIASEEEISETLDPLIADVEAEPRGIEEVGSSAIDEDQRPSSLVDPSVDDGSSISEDASEAREAVSDSNVFAVPVENELPSEDEVVAAVVEHKAAAESEPGIEVSGENEGKTGDESEPDTATVEDALDDEPPTLISGEPFSVESNQAKADVDAEQLEDTGSGAAVDAPAQPKPSDEPVVSKSRSEPDRAIDGAAIENVENVENVEKQILKPVEELDPHDPFAAGAIYDSVRIMENHEIPASELPTRTGSVPDRISEELAPKTDESAEPEVSQTAGNTAHNIGEGDTDGKRSSKLKPLSEGTLLNGRYEIVRKIGGGGMGAVYLASDNNLGGVLRAVKEMVQAHIEDEQQEKAISDFKRESMILSTLDHPSIPTIFDYFFDENEHRFYLVMKYISGGDLAARLRSAPEGRLDERTVTEWAIQIADVLDYLHNQPSPIVYRDLKPSNIMVDGSSGRIMLIDFGIARSISQREEKGVTAVGTMGYAPPELFSGNVEPRSDIYSLGSTIFHLLTGADPQSNPLLIFDFQKNPRPRQINPQLSDQIERILMKSVEYTSQARFASAAELKAALEDHLAALDANALSFGVKEAPSSVSLANQAVFCGFCGQRIVATDLFCAFCGSKQPIAQEGVRSGSYSRAGATAKLFVEGTGELSAPTFSLVKDENLVGRRDPMSNIFPEIDLSKYDPQTKISRRHARIWRNGPAFLVEDLGSSNGTILSVSGIESMRLIPHKPQALNSGDRIKVGDTTLHFMVG
ncbi:MAG TPA: protein kinase [Pyrinomonadaceae bacterium]|nr:protein kinase [Pyrinomonadaceae bacterium]HMP66213.1 protein kinase [Pyrinomonadaceae bacterium]